MFTKQKHLQGAQHGFRKARQRSWPKTSFTIRDIAGEAGVSRKQKNGVARANGRARFPA